MINDSFGTGFVAREYFCLTTIFVTLIASENRTSDFFLESAFIEHYHLNYNTFVPTLQFYKLAFLTKRNSTLL